MATTSKKAKSPKKKSTSPAQKNEAAPLPTSFAEISRAHRSAISTSKGSVVVTAARHGEGTTLFAHLMASRSSENGTKTLLIDLNLKDTALTQNLDLERKIWDLPNRETGDLFNDLITQSKTSPNLYFMAAPRDEASILFLKDTPRAHLFFTALEKQFPHIIVDTTHIGALNHYNIDPVLLAAAARRTVLIHMAGVTPEEKSRQVIDQLEEAGARISGVIINDLHNPSLKEELLSFISSLQKFMPGLYTWLRHKINHSDTLS